MEKWKVLILFLLMSTILTSLQGQDINRRWGIGGGVGLKDYSRLPEGEPFDMNAFNPAIYAHFGRVLAPSWELQLAGMIPFPDFTYSDSTFEPNYQSSFHLRYRLNNGYILPADSRFGPYLSAGVQASFQDFQDQDYYLSIPVGIGFRLQPAKFLSFHFGGDYHLAAVATRSLPLVSFQAGLTFHFGKDQSASGRKTRYDLDGDGIRNKKDKCPQLAGLPEHEGCPDADLDGVPDGEDKCASIPGIPENEGCPREDIDQDGLVAPQDQCPEVAGTIEGCPDRDGDGVVDKNDTCPDEAGPSQSAGCPDSDQDGIPDVDDRCPDEAGLAQFNGCPSATYGAGLGAQLEILAREIQFPPGTDVLSAQTKQALDEVAELCKEKPDKDLLISVYTDNRGDRYQLFALARKRALSCQAYLIQKGVLSEKLKLNPIGPYNPEFDNFDQDRSTENNRVDLKFFRL